MFLYAFFHWIARCWPLRVRGGLTRIAALCVQIHRLMRARADPTVVNARGRNAEKNDQTLLDNGSFSIVFECFRADFRPLRCQAQGFTAFEFARWA